MITKLNTARLAVQEGNWLVVNQILQQLPIEKNGLSESVLSEDEWEELLDLAIQILLSSDFGQRWEIAKLFPKLGNRAIAPLTSLLADESLDPEIRWFVGRILSQFQDPNCVIALAKLLRQTEEAELSTMAAQALAEMGIPAIAMLTDLLETPDTRLLSTQALSQIRHSEIIAPLLTVVHDVNPEVRATAIEALGSFHQSQIYPILVEALRDPIIKVKREAIVALGYLTEEWAFQDIVMHLAPQLYDLNPEICQQAAIALGRIGTKEAIAVLFPVLKSPATPEWLKIEIVRVLGWIETVDALSYLQEALQWNDETIAPEIITVLGRQELPLLKQQASRTLIEFFHTGRKSLQHPAIRQTLATSLGELGEETSSDLLLKLAQDGDIKVRLHALAALRKLSRN